MSVRSPRILEIDRFELDCGAILRNVCQAYFLDGEINDSRDNVVLVFHALTGSADAAGDWWSEVVGPGRVIDTARYAVLCANLLGSCYGTTGARAGDRDRFPSVTPRDMARYVDRLTEALEIDSVRLAVGSSLGGMVAMEWAACFPERTGAAAIFAAPAAHSASAIAWNHIQRRILRAAGPAGIEIARMVAMMTYRTPEELKSRFGRERLGDEGFQVESYLDHHGRKLRDRFDEASYRTLLDAMDAHDVGRGRGGIEAALAPMGGRLIGVGIPGDVLYPAEEVQAWTSLVDARYRTIRSVCGHDAFLTEVDQVAEILGEALEIPCDHFQSIPERIGS